MEDMPEAFINYNGETLRATPENSRLITFLGREALNIPDTIPDWMS